jgi:hypothetical protein
MNISFASQSRVAHYRHEAQIEVIRAHSELALCLQLDHWPSFRRYILYEQQVFTPRRGNEFLAAVAFSVLRAHAAWKLNSQFGLFTVICRADHERLTVVIPVLLLAFRISNMI